MRHRKKSWMDPRIKMALLFTVILCAGVAVGLLFTPVFHVQEVFCEGNVRITQDEITGAAQVETGKNILVQNLAEIKKRVADIPMVEEASVRRVFPNKIKIWIKERIPAAYIYTGNQCAVVDVDGKILDVLADSRVEQLVAGNTPVKESAAPDAGQTPEASSAPGETGKPNASAQPAGSAKPSASPSPSATPKPTGSARPSDTPEGSAEPKESGTPAGTDEPEGKAETQADGAEEALPYEVPLVVGLELTKPEPGKTADSRERDKLGKVLKTFRDLEKAGLLIRSTYLDVTNLNDVTLVIEKRLEIQLGTLDNMEYRSAFLAKVINEKISGTEHVIMDYRSEDIYVRQPEDGQARMIPKPSATPEPTGSAAPGGTAAPSQSQPPTGSAGTAGQTAKPVASAQSPR